jgi:hypothetical protein
MKEIKLTQNKVALVDDEDFEYINQFKWRTLKTKCAVYAIRTIRQNKIKECILMHRLIMGTPKDQDIDHINRNGLDNKKLNLRNCSRSENLCNRRHFGKSKYTGVVVSDIVHKYISKKTGVTSIFLQHSIWAALYFNKEKYYLGACKTEEQAAKRYDMAALYFHSEFISLNIS